MPRNLHRLRALLPLRLRCELQEHSPGRARRWRELPGLERVRSERVAVLSFDDGPDPSPNGTPAVLDKLDEIGAKATFFVVGEQMAAASEMVPEILSRGHEVGVHGRRHFRHDRVPAEESVADIKAGREAVAEAIGTAPRFYRPPYGKLSPEGATTCREVGLEVAYWSTWGLDWEPISAEWIARRVNRDLDAGSVVLLHDSARYATRPNASPTARSLDAIGARAAELGLTFSTLGGACATGAPGAKAAC